MMNVENVGSGVPKTREKHVAVRRWVDRKRPRAAGSQSPSSSAPALETTQAPDSQVVNIIPVLAASANGHASGDQLVSPSSGSRTSPGISNGNGAAKKNGRVDTRVEEVPVFVLEGDGTARPSKRSKFSDDTKVEDSKGKSLVDIDDEEDNIVAEPDERWEPPAAAAITTYVDPALDWVVVDKKTNRGQGLNVEPLQTMAPALPDTCVAELSDDEAADEELENEAASPSHEFENPGDGDDRTRVINAILSHERIRLRLHLEAKDPKRPGDCSAKAAKDMNIKGWWVNRKKRIGNVPGVEIGDVFFFRVALCIVGLHNQMQAGIAWIKPKDSGKPEVLATSIVMSGGYEDDLDDGDTFVYTGQGGNQSVHMANRKAPEDQKLARGNLALANSCKYDTPVRVIRGYPDTASPSGKIYSYDGLYQVTDYWPEAGLSGFKVYKFNLQRLPGQRDRDSKTVKFSRKLKTKPAARTSYLQSVACEDISGGLERVPIWAVNEIDRPLVPPPPFKYITKVIMPPYFMKPAVPPGCRCQGPCGDREKCFCIQKNGGELPYDRNGTLIDSKSIVYECGPQCSCPATCRNRVSQRGQLKSLEVFKTDKRGWGVRCRDAVPFGTFICEYVGELLTNEEAERRVGHDEYIFDIDCINGSRARGVDISCFFESSTSGQICERVEEHNYSIDAANCGNISRFINHSCDPNIFVQCVFYDHYDLATPHIMMYAMKHIRPFEELSYDYGYSLNSVRDASGKIKKKPCYCGSRKCRKRLY